MTNEETIKMLRLIKSTCYLGNRKFLEAINVAIEALQNSPTQMSGTSGSNTLVKQLNVLADTLDGCRLTYPCDKLWEPTGWCEKHCNDGQVKPSKECWLKYAEVMAKCTE